MSDRNDQPTTAGSGGIGSGQDRVDEPRPKPVPTDPVDEAEEESFPASDPPESYHVD